MTHLALLWFSQFLTYENAATLKKYDFQYSFWWDSFQNETTFSRPTNGTKPKMTKNFAHFCTPELFLGEFAMFRI